MILFNVETSYPATRHNSTEDLNLQQLHYENLKSRNVYPRNRGCEGMVKLKVDSMASTWGHATDTSRSIKYV
jgi:hypothetical protein